MGIIIVRWRWLPRVLESSVAKLDTVTATPSGTFINQVFPKARSFLTCSHPFFLSLIHPISLAIHDVDKGRPCTTYTASNRYDTHTLIL